ncbi:MAG TPA: PQQ-binding-like beta-propeller repeat protein, partial [Kofleriaceae bacterium]|nr:PQQ-binding-like beta-propeller repeat protein [Kofleriaceae bacterium]
TIHDGEVLVPAALTGADSGRLYRYQLAGGAPLDPVDLTGPVTDGLAVGGDGTIYAAATPLQAVAEGGVTWSYPMDGNGKTGSNAAIGPSGTIYVGGRGLTEHNLHAVNPDGSRKWAHDVGASIIDPIAVDDEERIYALTADGVVVAYEASGELAWSIQLPSFSSGGGIVIGPDRTIYVGTIGTTPGSYEGEHLFAVREGEGGQGAIVWKKKVGLSWIPTTPALSSGGTLYVSDFCKTLTAVRASDGEELWSYELPEVAGEDLCASFSAPAIGPDGRVYVWNGGRPGGEGAGLYVFRGDGTGPADSPWPQEGGDPAHTGRVAPGAR